MRLYISVAALIGWFALALQFYLMIVRAPSGVAAIAATIVSYFSFFTILTNILVAAVLTFTRWGPSSGWGSFFSRPTVQTATATYIAIVGITYSLLLRELWSPTGAQKLADVLLHDGMPVIFMLFWLIWVHKERLGWKDAVTWLIYPFSYLIYLLIRGAFTGLYPYPFIDVTSLGYPRMMINAVGFLFLFLGVGLCAVGTGRWAARRKLASAP
jgi:hypothetical protein